MNYRLIEKAARVIAVDDRDIEICGARQPYGHDEWLIHTTTRCNGTADREPCPVRAECLQYALDHDERFGIWGGYSERERRALRHGADCTCAGCQQVWERIARESRGVA